MLGFSMGGMAIVLAFSTAKIFRILAEDGADDSFFIQMMGAFFHFILVQSAAILVATAIKAYPVIWLSGIGFWLFSYAVLVGVATAGQLLSTGKVINFAESIKRRPAQETQNKEVVAAINQMAERFDRLLEAMVESPPLDVGTLATRGQASDTDASEGSGGTRIPKGRSEATSSTPKRKSAHRALNVRPK